MIAILTALLSAVDIKGPTAKAIAGSLASIIGAVAAYISGVGFAGIDWATLIGVIFTSGGLGSALPYAAVDTRVPTGETIADAP